MLIRTAVLAAVVGALLTPSTAMADSGPIQVQGNNDGVVSTNVTDPGRPPHRPSTSQATDSSLSTCIWMQVFYLEHLALPSSIGGQQGGWWQQYCGNSGWAGSPVFVPVGTAPASVLQASPGTLAQRAANELRLPTPHVGLNPRPRALVNLAEWFWIPGRDWPTLRQRTQAGPVWAVVVARPVSTSWDPGDGSPAVTCAGPGTPYDEHESASVQHTDCSYTYTRSSAGQPQTGPDPNDRFFTVTVTTSWQVTWTGAGGTGGSLPPMTRSMSFPLAVAERDVVVTGGSG